MTLGCIIVKIDMVGLTSHSWHEPKLSVCIGAKDDPSPALIPSPSKMKPLNDFSIIFLN
jgi:hypothetical protein